MGYLDALNDGIPHEKDSKGFDVYYPPCSICGTAMKSCVYSSGKTFICADCRKELVRQKAEQQASTSVDVKEEKLKEALKRIAKVADTEKYRSAVEKVRKGFHVLLYYQSTEEIMTALELMRRNIKTYHQVKIYNYRVDFVLPEYKTVLEIDGEIYHPVDMADKSAVRDEVIQDALGSGWEVIHIKTSCINKNITKPVPAIKAVLKRRRKKHFSRIQ